MHLRVKKSRGGQGGKQEGKSKSGQQLARDKKTRHLHLFAGLAGSGLHQRKEPALPLHQIDVGRARMRA